MQSALICYELVMPGSRSGSRRGLNELFTSNDLGTLEVLVRMDVAWRNGEVESHQQ